MAKVEVGDLKKTRALLVDLLWWYNFEIHDSDYEENVKRLESMINQIVVMRPLDSFGNHGNLHTSFCGCEEITTLLCENCLKRIDKYKTSDGSYIWKHTDGNPVCYVLPKPTTERIAQ